LQEERKNLGSTAGGFGALAILIEMGLPQVKERRNDVAAVANWAEKKENIAVVPGTET